MAGGLPLLTNTMWSAVHKCIAFAEKAQTMLQRLKTWDVFLFHVDMHKPCMKARTEARVSPFKPIYRYDNALTSELKAGI